METIKDRALLIARLFRSGDEGRPNYVILLDDESTYLMLVKNCEQSKKRKTAWDKIPGDGSPPPKFLIHLRLIPFSGVFRAEKDVLYPISKAMFAGSGFGRMRIISSTSCVSEVFRVSWRRERYPRGPLTSQVHLYFEAPML